MPKIRVHVAKNGDTALKAKRIVVLDAEKDANIKRLLLIAKNKLQMKASRIYLVRDRVGGTVYGREVVDTDKVDKFNSESVIGCDQIEVDDVLVFSKDKDFIMDEKQKQRFQAKMEADAERSASGVQTVVRVIAKHAWLEDEAVKQLERVSKTLPGVRLAIGLPDLHPGKGFPIGAAIATEKFVYPTLVGSDCGCGVSLFQTPITAENKALSRLDKLASKIRGLEMPWLGNVTEWLSRFGVEETTDFDSQSLGTIGGGNHFAELVKVVEVKDRQVFDEQLGLNEGCCQFLVHSGSRGLGRSLLVEHEDQFGTAGLKEDSEEGKRYMEKHEHACRWAHSNRHLIAKRFMDCLESDARCVIDLFHNNVEKRTLMDGQEVWIHRKGAAPADKGCVVLPGSRGSYTYLVQPVQSEDILETSGYSVAHGAGRRHTRSKAKSIMKNNPNKTAESLRTTHLGSYVVCEDKNLLYEESPEAYKDIDGVIADLEEFGIAKVVAIFTPLITYKTRTKVHQPQD